MFRIFDKLGVSNRIELMFMTLSPGTAAPPLLQDLLKDPAGDYDEATLALCEKAAEHGVLAAQLMLARMAWTGRASDSDVVRSYMWFCVALHQVTRTKNSVKKAMNPAQVVEAWGLLPTSTNSLTPLSESSAQGWKVMTFLLEIGRCASWLIGWSKSDWW